jgi:hypothetical protein
VFQSTANGTMADPKGDIAMRVIRTAARCDHVIAVASNTAKTVADGETASNISDRGGQLA